jgi:hypothetical protein
VPAMEAPRVALTDGGAWLADGMPSPGPRELVQLGGVGTLKRRVAPAGVAPDAMARVMALAADGAGVWLAGWTAGRGAPVDFAGWVAAVDKDGRVVQEHLVDLGPAGASAAETGLSAVLPVQGGAVVAGHRTGPDGAARSEPIVARVGEVGWLAVLPGPDPRWTQGGPALLANGEGVLAVSGAASADTCAGAVQLAVVTADGRVASTQVVAGAAVDPQWDRLWALGDAASPVIVTTRRTTEHTRIGVTIGDVRRDAALPAGVQVIDAGLLADGRVVVVGRKGQRGFAAALGEPAAP